MDTPVSRKVHWMLIIYGISLFLIIIISGLRLGIDWKHKTLLAAELKSFFYIKSFWGWVHLILYSFLGYFCGIELLPAAFIISVVFERLELMLQEITGNIIRPGGALDTCIDMTGYALGMYLRFVTSYSIVD